MKSLRRKLALINHYLCSFFCIFIGPYQGQYQPQFGGPEQAYGPHTGQFPPTQNQYSNNRQMYPPYGPEDS